MTHSTAVTNRVSFNQHIVCILGDLWEEVALFYFVQYFLHSCHFGLFGTIFREKCMQHADFSGLFANFAS